MIMNHDYLGGGGVGSVDPPPGGVFFFGSFFFGFFSRAGRYTRYESSFNFSDTNVSLYWTWFGDAHDLMTGMYLGNGHGRKLIDL